MNAYYQEKLKQGLYYQDFVIEELYKIGLPLISYSSKEFQVLIGENKAGLEIKNDNNYKKTGNLYIETAEKSTEAKLNYYPSGIFRNDNTWLYLIGDMERIFILSKKQLILLSKSNKYKTVQIATSQGFLLPVNEAEKHYAIKIIECKK
jgi:hypothetical protein